MGSDLYRQSGLQCPEQTNGVKLRLDTLRKGFTNGERAEQPASAWPLPKRVKAGRRGDLLAPRYIRALGALAERYRTWISSLTYRDPEAWVFPGAPMLSTKPGRSCKREAWLPKNSLLQTFLSTFLNVSGGPTWIRNLPLAPQHGFEPPGFGTAIGTQPLSANGHKPTAET
jgi:hypothetical protein